MKIILAGCEGRMGKVVVELAKQKKHEIVCGISRHEKKNHDFIILDDINKFDGQADVLIDFSVANATNNFVYYCVEKKIPAVICTTGLNDKTENLIIEAAKKIPIFKSANMSLGINIIALILKNFSQMLFDFDFDIEILEKHHNKKLDAPSGTALLLAEMIKKSVKQNLKLDYERNHLRNKDDLGIVSVRGGNIVGEHEIIFAGQNETIEIKHIAQSREIFALGAIKAGEFILNKNSGLYSMQDILKENLA